MYHKHSYKKHVSSYRERTFLILVFLRINSISQDAEQARYSGVSDGIRIQTLGAIEHTKDRTEDRNTCETGLNP